MMWKKCLASFGLTLVSGGIALAQVPRTVSPPIIAVAATKPPEPLPPVVAQPPSDARPATSSPTIASTGPIVPIPAPTSGATPYVAHTEEIADCTRAWASGEYLLWWIKDGPLPVPLVTTGNPADPVSAGALGRPGTVTLFGGNNLDYGTVSGMRLTAGTWLNEERTLGVEASGFLLEQRTVGFGAGSDGAGNPPIYNPLFRADLRREGAFTISDPLAVLGGATAIRSQTNLWGAEINGLANLADRKGVTIDLLAGFRYLDLEDRLTVTSPLFDPVNRLNQLESDSFSTRSQFYGAQVGGKVGIQMGDATLDVIGKVAFGETHQSVSINGSTTLSGPGARIQGSFPGGVFTQPSNIGRRTRNNFGVVPEGQIRLSYLLTPNLQAFVGYDFLYWSSVVRSGDQIDHNVNPTQSQGGVLVGQASPAPLFNRSDFWAQGVTFGLELRY